MLCAFPEFEAYEFYHILNLTWYLLWSSSMIFFHILMEITGAYFFN
jgi:hypothetical protein